MVQVVFKRSAYDERGSDLIATILAEHSVRLLETYSLRWVKSEALHQATWSVIYAVNEIELAEDLLTVHALRLSGITREQLGVVLVMSDDLDRRVAQCDFLYMMLHDPSISSDCTVPFSWVRTVSPKLFHATKPNREGM